jgi:hypothetical protein
VITQTPLLIVLPIWVLRAGSERGQRTGLLALSALSLLMMWSAQILRDFAFQYPGNSLQAELTYTFTVGTIFAVGFWLVLVGIVVFYGRVSRIGTPRISDTTLPAEV